MISTFTTRSILAVSLLALATLPAVAQEAPIKIAVVDLEVVVAESPGGKALRAKLEAFQQRTQAEGEALVATAKDLRQRLVDGANSLTPQQQAELQAQLEAEQAKIGRLRDDRSREGQQMQAEGLRQIEAQLEPVFEKVREEGGYDLILNKVPGVVVMAGDRIDITQKVIARLAAE